MCVGLAMLHPCLYTGVLSEDTTTGYPRSGLCWHPGDSQILRSAVAACADVVLCSCQACRIKAAKRP